MDKGWSWRRLDGTSRRKFLAMIGAAGGALAGYRLAARAATGEAAITVAEVKPGEDVFAYVSRVNGGFDQILYRRVIGAANEFKEGDQAIGVVAADEATRKNVRALLANTAVKDLYEHPLLVDELQQLIWQTTDQAQYGKVKDWTMGQLKEFLLTQSEAEIKAVMNGLTSDTIACVPKLMSNQELIALGWVKRSSMCCRAPRWGQKAIWAPASSPILRRTIPRMSPGRSSTPLPMRRATS